MATRKLISQIDRFAGLSDRAVPVKATRIESPDLINVDISERVVSRRKGYTRLNTNRLTNASLRLNPRQVSAGAGSPNPHGRILHAAWMEPGSGTTVIGSGNASWYVGIGCMMYQKNGFEQTLVAKGNSTNGYLFRIFYDPFHNNGATTGAWKVAFSGASSSFSANVADPNPIGLYRYCELSLVNAGGGTTNIQFKVFDQAGATLGTSVSAWSDTPWNTSVAKSDIFVGVSQNTTTTLGTDYFNGCLAELRLRPGNATQQLSCLASSSTSIAELTPSEYANFSSYYQLNDCDASNELFDKGLKANHGSLPFAPPAWTFAETEVLGTAGCEWKPNQNAFVRLRAHPSINNFAEVFDADSSAPNGKRWTIRGICVPKLPPYATIAPRGILLWAGISSNGQPIAIGVNLTNDATGENKFQARYWELGAPSGVRTLTISAVTVSSLAGKKVRFAFSRRTDGSATYGQLVFEIGYENGGSISQQAVTTNCSDQNPTLTASEIYIGARLSSFGISNNGTLATYDTTGFCGVIDDIQIVSGQYTVQDYVGLGFTSRYSSKYMFNEVSDWSFLSSNLKTYAYVRFNEGYGNLLAVESVKGNYTIYAYPQQGDGYAWDAGIVTPYESPPIRGIYDYKRFRGDGTVERNLLAVAGSSLYKIPMSGGEAQVIGAGFFQSDGLVSFGQYGNQLLIAEQNAQRPKVYDGTSLRDCGIVAPTVAPAVTLTTTGGTGFVASNYYLYYTFVNTTTGDESNPSPGVVFTPSNTTSRVTGILMATSPDPQVSQRRVYISAAGGVEGSQAYLAATIENNADVNIAVNILSAPAATNTSLEYFANREAPQGGVVCVFRDAAYIGGNQIYPTRLYRSTVGSITKYDWTSQFLDLDLDNGSIIKSMIRTHNYLYVSMVDGTARVYTTGDSNEPVAFDFLPILAGSSGVQAQAYGTSEIYTISEQDIYRIDGQNILNISSPDNPLYPSVEHTMRNKVNSQYLYRSSVACLSKKNQVWFALTSSSSTSNDIVLVYHSDQGTWSKYDIPAHCLAVVEDENDVNSLYAGVRGYVCKMNTDTADGSTTATTGTVDSGTTTSVTVLSSITALHNQTVFVFSAANQETYISRVRRTDPSGANTTITLYDSLGYTPVAGDKVCVGGIRMFFDLLIDYGNPLKKKRMRWVRVAGISDNDSNILRISTILDKLGRSPSFALAQENFASWTEKDSYKLYMIGGAARSMRIRISECADTNYRSEYPFPMSSGTIQVVGIECECEELDIP